jgi:hypothetical protein
MNKLILVGALLVGACGGDGGGSSGVDSTKQIKDLSADERMSECEWGVAEQGGAGKMTNCGNGLTVTVKPVADCVTQMGVYAMHGCTATVAQLEACTTALGANACDLSNSACAPIFACAQ